MNFKNTLLIIFLSVLTMIFARPSWGLPEISAVADFVLPKEENWVRLGPEIYLLPLHISPFSDELDADYVGPRGELSSQYLGTQVGKQIKNQFDPMPRGRVGFLGTAVKPIVSGKGYFFAGPVPKVSPGGRMANLFDDWIIWHWPNRNSSSLCVRLSTSQPQDGETIFNISRARNQKNPIVKPVEYYSSLNAVRNFHKNVELGFVDEAGRVLFDAIMNSSSYFLTHQEDLKPGHSGSAQVNAKGEILGITFMSFFLVVDGMKKKFGLNLRIGYIKDEVARLLGPEKGTSLFQLGEKNDALDDPIINCR